MAGDYGWPQNENSLLSWQNEKMTMKQLDHSFSMFRKTCMEKTGADSAQVDGLHKGNFPENDKKLKVITIFVHSIQDFWYRLSLISSDSVLHCA